LMNNVYYLGIELSPEYVKMAEKRILDFQTQSKSLHTRKIAI